MAQQTFGGELTPIQKQKLSKAPSKQAIQEHLEAFNQEIKESYPTLVVSQDRANEEALITLEAARAKFGLPPLFPQQKEDSKEKRLPRKIKFMGKKKNGEVVTATRVPEITETPVDVNINNVLEPTVEKKEITSKIQKDLTMNKSSLDDELADLEKSIKEKEKPVQEDVSQGLSSKAVLEALKQIPGAPSEKQIQAWKQELGQDGVHVTAFSPKEIYIYRHLTRAQWSKIQELLQKMQEANSGDEEAMQEKIVSHCMLWPQLDMNWKYNSRAGIVKALYEAIMVNSYFLTTQQVMMMTTEL